MQIRAIGEAGRALAVKLEAAGYCQLKSQSVRLVARTKQFSFITDTVFLQKLSVTLSGYIIASVSVFEMSKIFWRSVELLFPTKLSVVGVTNLDLHLLERSRNNEAHLATHGTWMRFTHSQFKQTVAIALPTKIVQIDGLRLSAHGNAAIQSTMRAVTGVVTDRPNGATHVRPNGSTFRV